MVYICEIWHGSLLGLRLREVDKRCAEYFHHTNSPVVVRNILHLVVLRRSSSRGDLSAPPHCGIFLPQLSARQILPNSARVRPTTFGSRQLPESCSMVADLARTRPDLVNYACSWSKLGDSWVIRPGCCSLVPISCHRQPRCCSIVPGPCPIKPDICYISQNMQTMPDLATIYPGSSSNVAGSCP